MYQMHACIIAAPFSFLVAKPRSKATMTFTQSKWEITMKMGSEKGWGEIKPQGWCFCFPAFGKIAELSSIRKTRIAPISHFDNSSVVVRWWIKFGSQKRLRFEAVKASLAHVLLSWFLTENDLVETTWMEHVLHISLSNHVRKHVMKVVPFRLI